MPLKEGFAVKLLIAGLLVLVGFGSFSTVSAKQAQEVSVKINTEARVNGVRVRFVELVEDSRCPTDTNCIWAGNATIRVRVTKNGRSKMLVLNTNSDPREVSFAGCSFRLSGLTPEPRSNIRINRNGYVAKIQLKKVK